MLSALCLGYRHDAGELETLSKYPHRVRFREEDSKAILHPLMHLPLDESYHLKGSCLHMGPIFYIVLQGLH